MQLLRHICRPKALKSLRGCHATARHLSLLSARRPQVIPSNSSLMPVSNALPALSQQPVASGLDIMPRPSSHPSMLGAAQARHGPRDTTPKITHRVRKRRLGFLARKKSRTGRKILQRRMAKGRQSLTH